jgi:hypothetical protein
VIRHRDQYVKPRSVIESVFSFQQTVDVYERLFAEHARR